MTYYARIHTDNRLHIELVSKYYDLLCYNFFTANRLRIEQVLQVSKYYDYYAIIFADNRLHIEPVSKYYDLLCYNFFYR